MVWQVNGDGGGLCELRLCLDHPVLDEPLLTLGFRIIEGIPTFVLGIAVWWWLADDPESARYLTPEEKQLIIIRKQRQFGYSPTADQFMKKDVILGLKDWKIWVFCLGQFGADTMLYG